MCVLYLISQQQELLKEGQVIISSGFLTEVFLSWVYHPANKNIYCHFSLVAWLKPFTSKVSTEKGLFENVQKVWKVAMFVSLFLFILGWRLFVQVLWRGRVRTPCWGSPRHGRRHVPSATFVVCSWLSTHITLFYRRVTYFWRPG